MNAAGIVRTPPALPRWVVYAVAGATFFDLSSAHYAIPGVAQLRLLFILLVSAIVGLFFYQRAWRPADAARSRLFKLLAVVVVIAVLGVPFAVNEGAAFTALTGSYFKVLLQGALVWAVCRTTENRLTLVRSVMLACLVACVLGLIAPRGDGGRLQGTFVYDANSLALMANMVLPLLAWYYYDRRNSWRWLALVALPIPLATIVLSSSRGGFLAFGAMGLATSLLYTSRAPKPLRKLFPAAIALGIVGVALAPADVVDRARSLVDGSDYNLTAEGGRIAIWQRGIGYAVSNPILGVGFFNFGAAEGESEIARQYARQGIGFIRNVAHSAYVEVLAELGLIGGSAYLLLMYLTIRDLFRRARSEHRAHDPDGILIGTLAITFVGFAMSIAFLSYAFYVPIYILYGLVYGYFDGLDRPGLVQESRGFRSRVPRGRRATNPRPSLVMRRTSGR